MSISFGGLGLITFRSPFAELVGMVSGKTDLRTICCFVVLFIVTFVLAYLTNPTENSFRAYLTEQSFRQHLSRLDDNADTEHEQQDNSGSRYATKHSTLATAHTLSFDNSSPFHFANRASVSLRTPKHVFHSFGVFTVAAMLPLARSARIDERDLMISDSWYIGAFGHWWRGGIIEAWYQDLIARSKDEESWSSGILSMKNLDKLNECDGLPFSTKNLPPHLLGRGSPPKLRNREKSSQKSSVLPTRSSSPPPLPKSASLPLHIARLPSSSSLDRLPCNTTQPLSQGHLADQFHSGSPLHCRSSSTLFDHSPRIAEVLRQISHSKATVLEFRTQLSECQLCSSESHTVLQGEVDSLRERKRLEDASKLEVKLRTKALDDSKRSAEAVKKDAEKKLKNAQNARDNATQRMSHLDAEIAKLQQRLTDDVVLMRQSEGTVSEVEQDVTEALEHKKREIKIAEDIVAALNYRARELEQKLSEEKERLALLKESHRARKVDQIPRLNQITNHHEDMSSWTSVAHSTSYDATNGAPIPEVRARRQSLAGLGRRPSVSRDGQNLPMLGNLIISGSNFGTDTHPPVNATQAALRANGYSVFDDSIPCSPLLQYQNPVLFSPFDIDGSQSRGLGGMVSPTSQSLIPSALITSLDGSEGLLQSFRPEGDGYVDKEWHTNNISPRTQHSRIRSNDNQDFGTTSVNIPSMPQQSSFARDSEQDLFKIRTMTARGGYGRDQEIYRHITLGSSADPQRTSWLHRTNSVPESNYLSSEDFDLPSPLVAQKTGPRRWFSTSSKEKPRKGLNPDAKVFSLPRKSSPTTYDALNPNGLVSTAVSTPTSATNSLLRAFAPSPAEREVLQRVLGGSTNASLERLPSLSDVGSIPSSPSHTHAHPATIPSAGEMGNVLPSWLQSLPRIRRPNFSPWEDEEPISVGMSGGSGTKHR